MFNQNNKLRRIAGTFYIFKKFFLQENYKMTGNEKQVFKDYSKQGKDRKWRERKLKNKSWRVWDCLQLWAVKNRK